MAVYKTYYCSNLGLFIYHDDRLSFKWRMIILCVYPDLYFSFCSFSSHRYQMLYSECVSHMTLPQFTYQSPFQFHVTVLVHC